MELVIAREEDHGRFSFIAAKCDDDWYFVIVDHWTQTLGTEPLPSIEDFEGQHARAYHHVYEEGHKPHLYPMASSAHRLMRLPEGGLLAAA